MKHILFGDDARDLRVAILIKEKALNKAKLLRYYVDPVDSLKPSHFVALSLWYNDKDKAPAVLAKE